MYWCNTSSWLHNSMFVIDILGTIMSRSSHMNYIKTQRCKSLVEVSFQTSVSDWDTKSLLTKRENLYHIMVRSSTDPSCPSCVFTYVENFSDTVMTPVIHPLKLLGLRENRDWPHHVSPRNIRRLSFEIEYFGQMFCYLYRSVLPVSLGLHHSWYIQVWTCGFKESYSWSKILTPLQEVLGLSCKGIVPFFMSSLKIFYQDLYILFLYIPHLQRNWPHVTTRKIFRFNILLDWSINFKW